MTEQDIIVGLLEKIRQRLRFQRFVREIAGLLALALIVPVGLKLVDLFVPIQGRIVAIALGLWAIVTLVIAVRSIQSWHGGQTLSDAAADVDRAAHLQDEMRTAYWFIANPSPSEWVAQQIRSAAQRAGALRVGSLYRRAVPPAAWRAAALLLAFLALNLLPLSRGHDWLQLQGASPFRLTRSEQELIRQTKKLLDASGGDKDLDKIVNDLEQGRISSGEAQQQISELRQQIDNGNLQLNNIMDGLASMANQLAQSPALSGTAESLSQGELGAAAEQIRELADKLGSTPSDVLRDLEKNMAQAAGNAPSALDNISKPMANAANAMKRDDNQAGKAALDDLAAAMDQMAQKINGQQMQSEAGRQLADLQNALQQESAAGEKSEGAPGGGDTAGASATAGAMPSNGDAPGNPAGAQTGGGLGTSRFGSNEEMKPGEFTKLDVQLKKEGLRGQNGKGGELQDLEVASRQERSAMDYRNVPSELSPAQKDALQQTRLPREQRQIVKSYFDEIRTPPAKAQ